MGHLPSSKHNGHFYFGPRRQKSYDMLFLGLIIVLVDLRPELHLLDDDVRLMLTRFLGFLLQFIPVLAVIHYPAYRRTGLRSHLHQIEIAISRELESVLH